MPKPRAAGQAESEIRGRLAISRPNLGATSATVISAQILAEFGHLKKRHNPGVRNQDGNYQKDDGRLSVEFLVPQDLFS
ncbi:MAG TPA: hypothetical protein VNV39_17950 [Stellaceae bacterium]|nr:hypothetical protein [Stellaceae bacterium]